MEPAYPFWLILHTYALIQGGGPCPENFEKEIPGSYEAIREVCIQERWITRDSPGFYSISRAIDIKEEVGDAPDAWVLDYFPGHSFAVVQARMAYDHVQYIQQVRDLDWPHLSWRWDPWIEEARQLQKGFDALQEAHYWRLGWPDELWRARSSLRVAQSVFGKEALLRGSFPHPYPVHRFTSLNLK